MGSSHGCADRGTVGVVEKPLPRERERGGPTEVGKNAARTKVPAASVRWFSDADSGCFALRRRPPGPKSRRRLPALPAAHWEPLLSLTKAARVGGYRNPAGRASWIGPRSVLRHPHLREEIEALLLDDQHRGWCAGWALLLYPRQTENWRLDPTFFADLRERPKTTCFGPQRARDRAIR